MNSATTERCSEVSAGFVLPPGVPPTFLCSACLSIFSGDPALFETRDELRDRWEANTFTHHDTLETFLSAAKEGCYVCSRVNEVQRDRIEGALQADLGGDKARSQSLFSTYEFHLGRNMEFKDREAEFGINLDLPDQRGYVRFLLFRFDGIFLSMST